MLTNLLLALTAAHRAAAPAAAQAAAASEFDAKGLAMVVWAYSSVQVNPGVCVCARVQHSLFRPDMFVWAYSFVQVNPGVCVCARAAQSVSARHVCVGVLLCPGQPRCVCVRVQHSLFWPDMFVWACSFVQVNPGAYVLQQSQCFGGPMVVSGHT